MGQFENVMVGGLSIEMWRAGAGRQILFLHSGEGSEPCLPMLQSLARRFEIIAPSHPGFGGSELPEHFTCVDDLAYFYMDLVRELALEDVILIGSSFGAWIAAQIAIKDTSPYSGLVLVGALGAKFQDSSTREITDLFSIPQYNQSQAIYSDGRKIDYSDWDDQALTRLARNHRSFALFGWSPTLHDPKLRRRLHRIDVPTLVVWGGEDRVASPDYGRHFAEAIPSARFVEIPGAGHYPHVESPDRFEAALDDFVVGIPASVAKSSDAK